jgi:hypothetical protein
MKMTTTTYLSYKMTCMHITNCSSNFTNEPHVILTDCKGGGWDYCVCLRYYGVFAGLTDQCENWKVQNAVRTLQFLTAKFTSDFFLREQNHTKSQTPPPGSQSWADPHNAEIRITAAQPSELTAGGPPHNMDITSSDIVPVLCCQFGIRGSSGI